MTYAITIRYLKDNKENVSVYSRKGDDILEILNQELDWLEISPDITIISYHVLLNKEV